MIDPQILRAMDDADLQNKLDRTMAVVAGLHSDNPEMVEGFKYAVNEIGARSQAEYEAMLDDLYRERLRRIDEPPPWTPFGRAYVDTAEFYTPEAEARYRMIAEKTGTTFEHIRDTYLTAINDEMWRNSRYQVAIRRTLIEDGEGGSLEMVHLSVKRISKLPLGQSHWADMQRIKNELLGPNCEAVELYPAEERLIDSANQYHLWGVNSGTYRWPIGWNEGRLVVDEGEDPHIGSHQTRPHG